MPLLYKVESPQWLMAVLSPLVLAALGTERRLERVEPEK